MIDFAYSRLNLRFNPFGELDRQQRVECAVPKIELRPLADFIASKTRERRAVQFLGSRGSGKTTHLWLLNSLLHDFHYLHIPEGATRSLPQRSHLMIDEAQRMTWWQRRNSFKEARRVILGTHRCYAARLRRLGFNTVTVQLDTLPKADWLASLLKQKIDYAIRCPENADLTIAPNDVANLRDQYGHNIRQIERHLYEVIQSQLQSQRLQSQRPTERIPDTELFGS